MQPCDETGTPLTMNDVNYTFEADPIVVVNEKVYLVEPYGATDKGDVGTKRTLLFAGGEKLRLSRWLRLFRKVKIDNIPLAPGVYADQTVLTITGKRLANLEHVRFSFTTTEGQAGQLAYLLPVGGSATDTSIDVTVGGNLSIASIQSVTVKCLDGEQPYPSSEEPPRRTLFKENGTVAHYMNTSASPEGDEIRRVKLNTGRMYSITPYGETDGRRDGLGGNLQLLFNGTETMPYNELHAHFPNAGAATVEVPAGEPGAAFEVGDTVTVTGKRMDLVENVCAYGETAGGATIQLSFLPPGGHTDKGEVTGTLMPSDAGKASVVPWRWTAYDSNWWELDIPVVTEAPA